MASGNRGLASAIAAGADTVPMALLEVLGVLDDRGGDVLLVLADEAVPPPLAGGRPVAGAVAFVLSSRAAPSARARVRGVRRGTAAAIDVPSGFAAHPCVGAFALLAATTPLRAGAVPLGAPEEGWIVDLEPAEAV
jgi:hypothetical protein